MKAINALEMRHLTNEIIASKESSSYEKAKSPLAGEIKYLEMSKAIMEDAIQGNHETTFHYDENYGYDAVSDAITQLKKEGFIVDVPNYSNYITISW